MRRRRRPSCDACLQDRRRDLAADTGERVHGQPDRGNRRRERCIGVVEHTGQSQANLAARPKRSASSGALVAVVENSTKPVTTRVTHAGIAIRRSV
jgi:hypothetical protein